MPSSDRQRAKLEGETKRRENDRLARRGTKDSGVPGPAVRAERKGPDVPGPRTVPELLAAATAAGPSDPFLLWGEESWTTFAEFELAARRFAGALQSRGITTGDRVAILMHNRPEFLTAAYGSMLTGALFVSINTALTASEATYIAGHSGARVLVSEPRHLALVEKISACSEPELVVLAPPNDRQPAGGAIRWADFLADPLDPAARGEDLAVIQYTSGTTASPKGVLLTQESLVHAFRMRARHLRYDATETMLVTGPLFHLNAQSVVTARHARRDRQAQPVHDEG